MIGDVTPQGTVVKVNDELTYTEEVTDQHYCVNEKGKPLLEILNAVCKKLYLKHPELREPTDYFALGALMKSHNLWDTSARTAVFYVKGGSEGYYVHVEQHRPGHECLFLAKTLLEGESGRLWAEQMVCALSRILEV